MHSVFLYKRWAPKAEICYYENAFAPWPYCSYTSVWGPSALNTFLYKHLGARLPKHGCMQAFAGPKAQICYSTSVWAPYGPNMLIYKRLAAPRLKYVTVQFFGRLMSQICCYKSVCGAQGSNMLQYKPLGAQMAKMLLCKSLAA